MSKAPKKPKVSKFTKPKVSDAANDMIMSKKFDESILIRPKEEVEEEVVVVEKEKEKEKVVPRTTSIAQKPDPLVKSKRNKLFGNDDEDEEDEFKLEPRKNKVSIL